MKHPNISPIMLTSATPSPVIAGIEAPVDSRVRTEAASESADKTEPEEVDVDSSGASEVQEKEDSAVVDRDIFLSGQLAAAGTSHETAIVTAHALTSKYSRLFPDYAGNSYLPITPGFMPA